jgi:hypothetical protein
MVEGIDDPRMPCYLFTEHVRSDVRIACAWAARVQEQIVTVSDLKLNHNAMVEIRQTTVRIKCYGAKTKGRPAYVGTVFCCVRNFWPESTRGLAPVRCSVLFVLNGMRVAVLNVALGAQVVPAPSARNA